VIVGLVIGGFEPVIDLGKLTRLGKQNLAERKDLLSSIIRF
jgi:hypothetical protein